MQDSSTPPQRLDSWKEIAAYLGRDVRTAMRWAKSQRLPIRRVGGARGRSVFAFTHEIDEWLKRDGESPRPVDTPDRPAPSAGGKRALWGVAAGLGLVTLLGTAAVVRVELRRPPLNASDLKISFEGNAVMLRGPHGYARAVHPFAPSSILEPSSTRPVGLALRMDDDPELAVFTSVSLQVVPERQEPLNGALVRLTAAGDLRWRFEFNDTVRFGGTEFDGPWGITDWEVSPGPARRRIAVVGHHDVWWPGLLTVLDSDGRRSETFVSSGWLEHVEWLDNNRLLISGFDNPRDGGMMAVIDAGHPAGHSPSTGVDPRYVCAGCPDGDPLVYVIFPRSELNVAATARFNRAEAQVLGGRIVSTTTEAGEQADMANAIYEFDSRLRFVRASYADHYWEFHRRLELEGLIHHTRETCLYPEPPPIKVWTRAAGWRTVKPGQSLLQ